MLISRLGKNTRSQWHFQGQLVFSLNIFHAWKRNFEVKDGYSSVDSRSCDSIMWNSSCCNSSALISTVYIRAYALHFKLSRNWPPFMKYTCPGFGLTVYCPAGFSLKRLSAASLSKSVIVCGYCLEIQISSGYSERGFRLTQYGLARQAWSHLGRGIRGCAPSSQPRSRARISSNLHLYPTTRLPMVSKTGPTYLRIKKINCHERSTSNPVFWQKQVMRGCQVIII